MLNFKKLTFEDKELLQDYYQDCKYESCEYSAGIKFFWDKFYPYDFAISNDGALIVKYQESGNTVFEMPVCKDLDLTKALDEIDEYCIKNAIVPVFSDVPEEYIALFATRYNFTKIENFRGSSDYIYKLEDLRDFKGRHYSGQRNHINKFKSLYPDYIYIELAPGEDLSPFFEKYYKADEGLPADSYLQEKEVAMNMATRFSEFSSFATGAIELKGEIAAFCIGEILGDKVIIHIEKALRDYEGIYPLMVSEFLKHLPSGIEFVNREDDSQDKGLRISKLQYRPLKILSKYVILLQSELLYVESIPSIKTGRLVLDEIRPEDAAIYQRLCLDDERNRYWGYDYRDDLETECAENIPDNYFYNVAKKDFDERLCLNLAIRKDGHMIGEIVLYEADYRGGIEIGCRLFKEFEGKGYGKEAMQAAADWAIYSAGFRKVKAKCFKENTASFKMLSAFMKQIGEDEQFFFFEKNC